MSAPPPSSVLSRELLPASIAIYTTVALVAFEGLAVAAALPQVAAELGGVGLLPWVITGYLLTAGVATVVAGPLVDSLGARVVYRWAVTVFTVASVAAAFVPSMPLMVVARLLQGAGGGLIIAVALAAVSLIYPSHLIGRAFAANSTIWGVMGVAGPAIAAFMLTALNWRWIFLINLPLGLASLAAGWKVMPEPLEGAESGRVDVLGTLLVTGFTVTALLGVDELGPASVAWLGGAVVLAGAYAARARRAKRPVLRIEHVARNPYAGLGLSVGLLLAGVTAVNSYLPLYIQGGRGEGPALAAWSVLFFTIGWTLGANASGRLSDRWAESSLMAGGFLLSMPSLAGVAVAVAVNAPLPALFALFVLAGTGVGSATNAALTLLRAVTPPAQIGRAGAAHQFLRNQGFAFGSAIGGAVVLFVVGRRVGDMEVVREVLAGEAGGLGAAAAGAIRSGYGLAAVASVALGAFGFLPVVSLRRHLAEARRARRAARLGTGG